MNCSDGNSCDGNENTENTNATEAEIFFEPLYDSCLIVLAVFIIVINVLVPALFIRNRGLRTKTNILLVSLAIADMIMGFIGIPIYISCNALAYRPEGTGVCITAAVVYRFIAVSTIFHIFAITLERYISVSYPFSYVTLLKMNRLIVVIASIWIGSLLMALVQLSWHDISRDYVQESGIDSMAYKAGLIYNVVGVFFCFLIPFTIMIFIYYRMFTIIRIQIKHIREQNVTGFEENCKPLASERRAITIFALMLGVFMVCWLTWYMSLLSYYVEAFHVAVPEVVHNLFDFLRFSTSLINPLLYTFLKSDFRKAFCSLIGPKCGRLVQAKGLRSEKGLTTVIRYNNDGNSDETKNLTLQ